MNSWFNKEIENDVTPESVFLNRRKFMSQVASLGMIATTSMVCSTENAEATPVPEGNASHEALKPALQRDDVFPAKRNPSYKIPSSVGQTLTERLVAATHNNFYEFLPGRGGPVYKHTKDFEVGDWKLEITGECNKPQTLDLDAIFKLPHEERLYHFRCVERWAMNVPWTGIPMAALLKLAEPNSYARYVRFTSVARKSQMPGMRKAAYYDWPYVEALRLDEAMNPLTMMVTGAYGKPLPKQHGAPMRVIVPWKYGYKNPKSIVKIEFLKEQPKTFWMIQPHEYGFISNVNPFIPHPRWSQARSYWLGKDRESFDTPIFNGYEEYVADLYPDEPRKPQRALRQGQIAR